MQRSRDEQGGGGGIERAAARGLVREVLVAEVLDRRDDRAGRAVAEGAERAAQDVVAEVEQHVEVGLAAARRARGARGSAPASTCPRGTACTCRRTRACRTRSSAARRGRTQVVSSKICRRGCRAWSRPRPPPRSRAATSRCSAVSSGVDDPPGVQNFSSCPARMPPARSSSSRSVMPSGASYWPGLVTWPDSEKMPKPVDFSVPIAANHSAPLLDDVRHAGDRLDVVDHGRAGVEAGDRRERRPQPGLAAQPSSESSSAVSSPQM